MFYTSSSGTQFVMIWSRQYLNRYGLSQKKALQLNHKFLLVLCTPLCSIKPIIRKFTMSTYQDNTNIHSNCSSGNVSLIDIVSMVTSLTSVDKCLATTFSTPFLSLIVMSNSWSKMIHLSSLGFASYPCVVLKQP